jgi:hypothetical protein
MTCERGRYERIIAGPLLDSDECRNGAVQAAELDPLSAAAALSRGPNGVIIDH